LTIGFIVANCLSILTLTCKQKIMPAQTLKAEEYRITEDPYYQAVANEIEIFEAAYGNQLAISLRSTSSAHPFFK